MSWVTRDEKTFSPHLLSERLQISKLRKFAQKIIRQSSEFHQQWTPHLSLAREQPEKIVIEPYRSGGESRPSGAQHQKHGQFCNAGSLACQMELASRRAQHRGAPRSNQQSDQCGRMAETGARLVCLCHQSVVGCACWYVLLLSGNLNYCCGFLRCMIM